MTPPQRPHRSKQDYATPPNFIRAVHERLHIREFTFDLAADASNTKAKRYWTAFDDALSTVGMWHRETRGGWGFLNPPYSDIAPWAEACATTAHDGGSVALLVPASVGANWYLDFVHHRALVLALNGRLAFMPDKPKWLYPKDLILALYSPLVAPGFDVWNWRL